MTIQARAPSLFVHFARRDGSHNSNEPANVRGILTSVRDNKIK
jgi:hypothetical protein